MSKTSGRRYLAIGLMSGTSMDGIDVAAVVTDGRSIVERGASRCYDYPADFRARLAGAMADGAALEDRTARPGSLASVEQDLTLRHAAAVENFLAAEGLGRDAIDIVGFHGQTVLHRPERGLTVQIGDGPLLARRLGIDVVYDLRGQDCAAGGQGAPLAPVYHAALLGQLSHATVAVVNIGGVANVTLVSDGAARLAFDCGPGNCLIDDWVRRHTGQDCDRDGALAATGRVDDDVLKAFLSDRFYAAPAPKSLDRHAFDCRLLDGLSAADGAATLTAITAAGIAHSQAILPVEPEVWVITGGGRKNRTLMEMLAGLVQNAVVPAEAVGFDGDSLEAEAWAYLAVRSLLGLPLSYPGTTGVDRPLTGGVLARGRQ
jgi:anhydro-N-acetylmuramic acid kinase